LRLVTPGDALGEGHERHRPVVLHALGSEREATILEPIVAALDEHDHFHQIVVHRGEEDAAVPPWSDRALTRDRWLDVAADRPIHRLAGTLAGFERVLVEEQPELVVVAGGTDTALACALSAAKHGIALAHVGAGLRHRGGEPGATEFNRVLVDRLADTLLAPTEHEAAALVAESVADSRIHVVGHPGIDTLQRCVEDARSLAQWRRHGLPEGRYVLVDLAEAVGDPRRHEPAMGAGLAPALTRLARAVPVALKLPAGRVGELGGELGLTALRAAGLACLVDADWLCGLSLLSGAGAVVTDSGDVADDAAAVGVTCHTLGASTDRTHTLADGRNALLGTRPAAIAEVRPTPPLAPASGLPWDGAAAERVAEVLVAHYALVSAVPAVRS
jgi:UDP-N-acetylglucosamine 2-epimerase (non-hydrolysing)